MQKEGGRDGSASGEPVRSSRRVQGLLPEEHRTLDEVERDNRKRNAALRKAAQEARDASNSDEPEVESADSDAHQASSAKDSEDGSAGASEADPRKSDLEDDSQVVSSESSGQSEDSGLDQPEVEESDEESVVEVMVKAEPSAEDRGKGDRCEALTETSPPEVSLDRSSPESRAPGSPVTVDAHDEDMAPVEAEDVNQAGVQMTEGLAKFYVSSQCQRWKEAPEGRTVPPGIRYEWPIGKPDSQAYYLATLQTSRYLEQRMSVVTQAGAWISELRVRRNTFGLALDLAGLMIPVERLSPAECAAIIQTLLIESGFEFKNVIPVWSEA
ncbi:hypothetical protein PHMEG_00038252 [Phytophthora megakarya]|uniref:Uncharacterized protein n=1 Tax=Phytophthora megakarya TaxID=4795 RepID=A0A225UHI9_9STRA|nr:hypothetical protein PHMEG_00038252 [Phytophthora megakarya]